MMFQLMSSQFKIFIREPGVLFWVFGFPILMAWVLGIAFSGDQPKEHIVALVGGSTQLEALVAQGRLSKTGPDLELKIEGLGNELVKLRPLEESEALSSLRRGNLELILEERAGELVYRFDPRSEAAKGVFLLLSRGLNQQAQTRPERVEVISAKGGRYIDFLIPGLMAMGVMNSCIWGIGWATIELRMKKLLRRMVATPMPRYALFMAQFFNRVLISSLETAILFFFAWMYFDITLQGSFALFLLLMLCGNLAFAGIAVLMASRTANTTVGSGLVNLVTMPMMILSGVFFSYHNFPEWSWPVLSHLPLSLLADGMRAIMHEGAGLAQVGVKMGLLVFTGLVTFWGGLKLFKWY